MFKSILVHLTGSETDQSTLQTALQIAKPFDGHLDCLRVRMDAGGMVRLAADAAMAPAGVIADTFKRLKAEDAERTDIARRNFEDFCASNGIAKSERPRMASGVTAAWRECIGDDTTHLVARGRLSDLIILSRKSKTFVGLTPSDLGAIVFGCGRPVVLAPEKPPAVVGKKVALAWKDTAEAARALTAAAPILSHATRLLVLSAGENEDEALNCVECAEGMAESLRWRGHPVDAKYLVPGGRSESETILEAAYAADADLLISGAYGHSRLRETVFGGFTQRLLEGADLPVFLFH